MLFKIGENDYTRKIRQGTYKVNSYDVYKEWQDANADIHRSVIKQRISGSFTMYFGNEAEFTLFLSRLASVRENDSSYNVWLMTNNNNTFNQRRVYMDFRPAREQKIIGEAWYPELAVTIQGR